MVCAEHSTLRGLSYLILTTAHDMGTAVVPILKMRKLSMEKTIHLPSISWRVRGEAGFTPTLLSTTLSVFFMVRKFLSVSKGSLSCCSHSPVPLSDFRGIHKQSPAKGSRVPLGAASLHLVFSHTRPWGPFSLLKFQLSLLC